MSIFGYRKVFRKKALLLLLFWISTLPLQAAWVENIPTTVKNPDGSIIECFASGDEFFNYLHDSDGFTIIAGEDGFHYYAIPSGDTLVASTLRAGEADPKQAGLTSRAGISEKEYQQRKDKMFEMLEDSPSKAAHSGMLNNLVVYIRFSDDTEFTTPRSTFDERLNNDQAPSVKNYFQEVSYGMVTVESQHYPPSEMNVNISYQDVYPRSYFEPYHSVNNPNGYTSSQRTGREHQLLHRAINAIAEHIPEDMDIDNDGDGRVDNVCFVIKGGAGPWASILWAHRWALFSTNTYINGKRVWDYTFQPETQATVQILNHELFHTFGAPDLYRYSSTNITPVGPWDLMHSGHGHMSAFMKWKYTNQTWISDIPEISTPGTYTLNPLTSPENNAFRINSPNSDTEYFVVEYRKKEPGTYENNLPGSGLLIYRINTLAGNGNANGPPDEVYLYRPNGTNNLNGVVFSANYSSQVDRTEISDSTNPSAFLSDDSNGGLIISNIGEAGSTISFDLFGGPTGSFEITAEASPEHGGTIEGAGTWYEGHSGTLTATPANGFSFENWTENGNVVSTQSNYSFTASADRHLVANFGSAVPVWPVTLTANPTDGGSVSGGGNHEEGENITVTATPSAGYDFINWTENGSVVSTSASYSFVVEESRELAANFVVKSYQITLTANPSNGGNLTGAGTVNHGTVRAVNAFPAEGFTFENWTENGVVVSSNTQYIFQTTSDRDLTANFSSESTDVFSITLNSNPAAGGSTSGAGEYNDGQQATLSAIPSDGYHFVNWTEGGNVVSSQASYSFTVTTDRFLTANFALTPYTITLNANPTAGGSVTGGGSYNHGITAVVSATPQAGYEFVNWTENGNPVSTSQNYSFSVTGNRNLTAHFSLNTYTITVNAQPSVGGEVSGGGSYDHGQTATLSALPENGYTFLNWTENGNVVSSEQSYTFNVTTDRNLTANFSMEAYAVSLQASPADAGSLSGGGSYNHGETVTVNASPSVGYTFINWTENGNTVSADQAYSFTITDNRNLTAHFSPETYSIVVNAQPSAGGTVSGGGTYEHDQAATLSASPASGYTFLNWTENGNVVSSEQNYTFNVTADRNLSANFSMEAYSITVNAQPSAGGTVSGGGTYEHDQAATLSASPASGYTFLNWTENGNVVSSEQNYTFNVTADRNLTANFSMEAYAVSLQASPADAGSLSGAGNYNHGQTVAVNATPNEGYTFVNWTENGNTVSTSQTYSFTISGNRNLTAHFSPDVYNITVNAQPSAGGTVSGGGTYEHGQTVAVNAAANPDFAFLFWTENGEWVSFDQQYSFIANSDRHLSAVFESTSGLITIEAQSEPAGFAIITGAGFYNENEWVELGMTPVDESALFLGWAVNGNIVSTEKEYRFRASQDQEVIALFKHQQRIFNVKAVSKYEEVLIKGTGRYRENEIAMLEVSQHANLKFIGWKNAAGQIISRRTPYSFDVNRDVFLEALFEPKTDIGALREEKVTLYPNPSDGKFYVNVETPFALEIRNTSGLMVWKQNLEPGDNFVDISYLPLGIYLINLYSEGETISRKIILK